MCECAAAVPAVAAAAASMPKFPKVIIFWPGAAANGELGRAVVCPAAGKSNSL